MKIKLLFSSCLLFFAQMANAELAECKRVGYTSCTVDTPCHAMVYARGGMCIKLLNLAKGAKYTCHKSGVVAIDKLDYDSAKAVGLSAIQPDLFQIELDATQINTPTAMVMFGIYDPYDTPEKFTVTCEIIKKEQQSI